MLPFNFCSPFRLNLQHHSQNGLQNTVPIKFSFVLVFAFSSICFACSISVSVKASLEPHFSLRHFPFSFRNKLQLRSNLLSQPEIFGHQEQPYACAGISHTDSLNPVLAEPETVWLACGELIKLHEFFLLSTYAEGLLTSFSPRPNVTSCKQTQLAGSGFRTRDLSYPNSRTLPVRLRHLTAVVNLE